MQLGYLEGLILRSTLDLACQALQMHSRALLTYYVGQTHTDRFPHNCASPAGMMLLVATIQLPVGAQLGHVAMERRLELRLCSFTNLFADDEESDIFFRQTGVTSHAMRGTPTRIVDS